MIGVKEMRRSMRFVGVVAAFAMAAMAAIPAQADPGIGQVFDDTNFSCGNNNPGDHCVDTTGQPGTAGTHDWKAYSIFSSSVRGEWTNGGTQHFEIKPGATQNDDNRMSADFTVSPGQKYSATAWVITNNYQLPFRARLVLHWWDTESHGSFKGECGVPFNANSSQTAQSFSTGTCTVPTGAHDVAVSIGANNGCDGCPDNGAGYGTVKITRVKFVRES